MKRFCLGFLLVLFIPVSARSQGMDEPMASSHMAHMNVNEHSAMAGLYGDYGMTREASGTSWQPESTPMEGLHVMKDDWMFMFHGFTNFIDDKQSGPRGDEKIFNESMFMFMASHPLKEGTFGFRSMMSLDPLMGKDGYPVLLQTGETPDGLSPLIDRQHPHDLFMELAASYSYPVFEDSSLFIYGGLPGEPALGPPTFMHRFSGIDNPTAPISHHWLDSTHITFGVATLGYVWKDMKVEGSAFRGREPDEKRWDIERPKLDSYSGRLTYNPGQNWSLQASYGRLHSPEQLHPETDTGRYTASVMYNQPFTKGNWQTTLAWGRNNNSPGNKNLDALVAESGIQLLKTHTVFSRFEHVEKDELFDESDPRSHDVFKVNEASLGYIYDFPQWRHMQMGVGGEYTWYFLPKALDTVYGKKPRGYMIFIRLKI